jgi:hypothetical protein
MVGLYNLCNGRLAERLNAPVLLNRALMWKRIRCKESNSVKPLEFRGNAERSLALARNV